MPEAPTEAALEALGQGAFPGPAVVVVAHPDDETVLVGGLLARLPVLTLAHVTDGAPADMADARRLGFESRDAYRAARAAELDEALAVLGVAPRRVAMGLADQSAADDLVGLTEGLARELDGAELVLTHAYEGGHPDHDACAFAVQAACSRMARPPVRLEFPAYHARGGARVVGRFHPDPAPGERKIVLAPERAAAKREAMARHRTQAEVLAWFPEPEVERLRAAPDYDFTAPPPSGEVLYDGWRWSLTSAGWQARAAAALAELGLLA